MTQKEHIDKSNLMDNKKQHLIEFFVYIIMAMFYYWMADQIPYTHDDWDWGLPIGMEQLLTASINSRYVGNFFVVIMTRSEIAKVAIMGTGYWLLPFLIAKFAISRIGNEQPMNRLACFLLCNALILSINKSILAQTYNWVSGFANYCISAIFLIIIIDALLYSKDDKLSKNAIKTWKCVLMSVFCLAGQLFLENIALFVVIAAFLASCLNYIKHKNVSKLHLFMFLGAVVGMLIMFSSKIYGTLWIDGAMEVGDRKLLFNSGSTFDTLINNCFLQFLMILNSLFTKRLVFYVIVQTILLIQLGYQKKLSKKILIALSAASVLMLIIFVGYQLNNVPSNWYEKYIGIISTVFVAIVIFEIITLFREDETKLKIMLFTWLSPILIWLPLCFTSERGLRLFFTSDIMLILMVAMLFCECLKRELFKKNLLATIICLFFVVTMVHKSMIYYNIGSVKRQRDEMIDALIQSQNTEICLPAYPHEEYLWNPDPINEKRVGFFREFFGIKNDVIVSFESE